MKTLAIITLIILSLTIVSSTKPKSKSPNRDSWSIRIGEKVLMATWLGNEMGDTVELTRIKLRGADTLFAGRFLCGYSGEDAVTTLTIKNCQNEIVAESVSHDSRMVLTTGLAIREFLYSSKIKSGEVISVYFSIKDESKKRDYTTLLGNLRLN